jgi:hypothetical protein
VCVGRLLFAYLLSQALMNLRASLLHLIQTLDQPPPDRKDWVSQSS